MEISSLITALHVQLGLEVVAGHGGLNRGVTGSSVQKPGLALAGFAEMINPGRIQVIGRTEIDYLWSLSPEDRAKAAASLFGTMPPGVFVTRGADIPEQLIIASNETMVPLLRTPFRTSIFVEAVHKFLIGRLAWVKSVHGVLMDVFGMGVLIMGKSGIGKSECALELITRGHRLVADDVVDVTRRPPATIIGGGNELLRHNMEIRGLGIINIKDLFGISAIRDAKQIDLVVIFEEWEQGKDYERIGTTEETYEILGVSLPKSVIPVRPGRSLTSIVEVAARNQILKVMGHHSSAEFLRRIHDNLNQARKSSIEEEDLDFASSNEEAE